MQMPSPRFVLLLVALLTLFTGCVHPAPDPASTYEPISSVWEGTDSDLLERMFHFYAVIPTEPILDATYNAGRMWKGSKP